MRPALTIARHGPSAATNPGVLDPALPWWGTLTIRNGAGRSDDTTDPSTSRPMSPGRSTATPPYRISSTTESSCRTRTRSQSDAGGCAIVIDTGPKRIRSPSAADRVVYPAADPRTDPCRQFCRHGAAANHVDEQCALDRPTWRRDRGRRRSRSARRRRADAPPAILARRGRRLRPIARRTNAPAASRQPPGCGWCPAAHRTPRTRRPADWPRRRVVHRERRPR